MAANVIFDFDGTLANSLPVVIEVANQLLDRPITIDDYERLKNLPNKTILKELGIPLRKAPRLVVKGRMALAQHMGEIPLFDGVREVIEELATQGHRLFVISSNSLENVEKFLRHNHIDNYFEKVYGGVGVFGKASVIKRVVRAHDLDKAKTLYVGDEARDIEAAHRAGVRSVAVTWGYAGARILGSSDPEFLLRKPQELLKAINAD